MKLSSVLRSACAVTAVALISTSCGGSGESDSAPAAPQSGALAGICPEKVVVQTDWFPEAEHGGIYELLGADAEKVASAVKQATGGDFTTSKENAIKVVKALGIELITEAEVTKVSGSSHIEKIEYMNSKTKETKELNCQTLVAALGFTANIGPLAEWGLNIESRKIVVDSGMHTNIERLFAAGDISTYPGKVALISVGFGEAATAVNNAMVAINPDAHLFPGHSSGSVE